MKIRIKLYGTLSKSSPGYDHTTGIDMEIPDHTRIRDLLEKLNLPQASVGMVTMDGKLVKSDDSVRNGSEVKFFQPISGG